MLHHFPHQGIDGRWHVVYRLAGCSSLASVEDCPSEEAAQFEARRLNREQAHQHKAEIERAKMLGTPGHMRPIPAGFYSDKDAA